MKFIRKFALCLCASVVSFSAIDATAQISSPTLYTLTNLPATLASNVIDYTTNIVPLTKNCALAVAGRTFSAYSQGAEVLSGSFSLDGTNFGLAPFTLTALNSVAYPTNGISQWTNWSQAYLGGFAYVNFTLITNTGAGTTTNLGWIVSRPTLNTATY